MSTAAFDKLGTNHQLLLSLPFREGAGVITRDVAKPGHQDVDLVGFPNWISLASGLGALEFDGAADYLECAAAKCADLDFTSEDYSITCWVNHYNTGHFQPKILLARYEVDFTGWETYLESDTGIGVDYLEHRHHHVSLAEDRDGCFSTGWTPDSGWAFLGITRSGLYPQHYRNGLPLVMSYGVNGMRDPDACNRDLVIGVRFTKGSNFYLGQMWDPRVWLGELSAIQMMTLYHMNQHWFGV